jgi:hypothetical protein
MFLCGCGFEHRALEVYIKFQWGLKYLDNWDFFPVQHQSTPSNKQLSYTLWTIVKEKWQQERTWHSFHLFLSIVCFGITLRTLFQFRSYYLILHMYSGYLLKRSQTQWSNTVQRHNLFNKCEHWFSHERKNNKVISRAFCPKWGEEIKYNISILLERWNQAEWGRQCLWHIVEIRSEYKCIVGKPEGNTPLGRQVQMGGYH